LLTRKPNHWQSASKFKRLMQYKALTDGNAYALPIRSGDRISELIPLIKGRMRIEQANDWSVDYIWTDNHRAETKFKPADVFHIMGPSEDGLIGQSMQDVARDVISLSRKSDETMRAMMDKGIRPGGAFSSDIKLSDEAFSRLKKSIEDQYSGAENSGQWLILEDGLKANPFTINAKDGQSVELRNQLVEEVARFFGIPRPLMMMDDTSWGSGIEQLAIFYVVYCLGPWFTVWEEEIALKLLSVRDQDKYYAKINERALLRGSMKDQGEYLSKLLGAGGAPQVIEQNEARSLLDMPPHDDGTGLNPGSVNSGASNAQPTP
jgi:HK97 family phage portal protein